MIEISRAKVQSKPEEYWNAFNEILAMSDAKELSGLMLQCYWVYWYASEVHNGGHAQYFSNKTYQNQNQVLQSLVNLGASIHAKIFSRALVRLDDILNDNLDSMVVEEIDCLLESLDSDFFRATPNLFDLLQETQRKNENALVKWTD